jgi:hypothetical protein
LEKVVKARSQEMAGVASLTVVVIVVIAVVVGVEAVGAAAVVEGVGVDLLSFSKTVRMVAAWGA